MPRFLNWSFPTVGLTAACLLASVAWTLHWLRRHARRSNEIDQEQPTAGTEKSKVRPAARASDDNGATSSVTSCVTISPTAEKPLREVPVPDRGLDDEESRAERSSAAVGGATPDRIGAQFDFGPPDSETQKSRAPTAAECTPPTMCLSCGKYDGKLFRCSRCQSVCFCSVECQRAAWKTHKSDCARLAQSKRDSDKALSAPSADSLEKSSSQSRQESILRQSGTMSHNPEVAQLQEQGICLFHSGKYSDALAAFEQMKSASQENSLRNDEGRALRLIGDALDKLNAPFDDIEDNYKAALKIAHEKDDMELSFHVLSGMATHACKDDDLDLGEHFYLQALTLAQRCLTQFEEGLAEGNLATCLARTEQRRLESITHFRKAIALQKGSAHGKAALHSSLASVLSATGKTKEAHVEYKRALDHARGTGNREVEMQVLADLADLHELVDPDRARECRELLAAMNA